MLTRRAALQAGLVGAVALAYGADGNPAPARAAASADVSGPGGTYAFNQDWLFGGRYVTGSEAPGYSERGFANVTLPHTVTPLSWGDWDHSSWEQVWIYRKHINRSAVAGGRVFVDFQAVMGSAAVYVGGVQVAEHQGGYLPWSVELTQQLVAGDNVLAVVVDARWLDVPPDGNANGAPSVDYLQPGGIYRDAALRIVPQVFISDVFAKPTNVLSANPGVDVQFTIDAASVPSEPVLLSAAVLDGANQLGTVSGTVPVTTAGETVATLSITGLSGVTLWSPDTPKLYQVQTTVTADGVSHAYTVTGRLPPGYVPNRRFLPQRPAAGDLRSQPPSAVSIHGHGRGRAPAAARCRVAAQRAELQHGALFALPAVAVFPGRLRRAGADGVGGAPGVAVHGGRGLPGAGAPERARHGGP